MTAYTTEQIVEAMARGICETEGLDWESEAKGAIHSGSSMDDGQEAFKDCARVALAKALEMMQEPTEEQILAAGYLPVPDIRWRAMIQARREELG